ncbi:MAG: MBL fold metallo-hydrolase [Firmicutes bacterium]|nr:MBL fold metallo-hydrolase [Bacillota bacterium]
MKITWIGHSCFKIEKDGFTVVFDPYEDGSVPGLISVREKANMVISSHGHGDHSAAENVEIIYGGACPFIITSVESFHDGERGALRGVNNITILDAGEVRLAHFGDQGCMPDDEAIEELMDIDVALIPVGGYYTVDGIEASEIVRKVKAKTIIPMHYRDEERGFGFDVISTVYDFVNAMGSADFTEKSVYDTAEEKSGAVVLVPTSAS